MAAQDPARRKAAASIASNVRWAMAPNRSEATAAARRNSPVSLDYWRRWAADQHPDMSKSDQLKAAKNAHSAHMRRMALKASQSRAERAAAQTQKGRSAA